MPLNSDAIVILFIFIYKKLTLYRISPRHTITAGRSISWFRCAGLRQRGKSDVTAAPHSSGGHLHVRTAPGRAPTRDSSQRWMPSRGDVARVTTHTCHVPRPSYTEPRAGPRDGTSRDEVQFIAPHPKPARRNESRWHCDVRHTGLRSSRPDARRRHVWQSRSYDIQQNL